jgi:hypothetical protein
MRRLSRLHLLTLIALSGLALASAGCSSMESPPDGAAQGGSSGHAGSGGAAGADAGTTCGSLIADYAAAFQDARTCSPLLTTVQCTHLASASLQCPSCPVHVNDTTRLDAIRAAFEARTDCIFAPCPALLCVNPGTSGACVANDSGSAGSCIDVQ